MHDSRTATALLDGATGDAVIADKAYDSNAIREHIAAAGMKAVIPSRRRRKVLIPLDAALYRERNRIERCFNKLKNWRGIATRTDKTARNYHAGVCLAATNDLAQAGVYQHALAASSFMSARRAPYRRRKFQSRNE